MLFSAIVISITILTPLVANPQKTISQIISSSVIKIAGRERDFLQLL
jgi:hypothetical protein